MAVRRTHGCLATALLVALAGCAQPPDTGGAPLTEPTSKPAAADPSTPALPAGWRWESFAGVQVGVPAEFGWGNGSQRLGQWCIGEDRDPIVGRPGPSTLVGCPTDPEADPSTLLDNTGPVVSLSTAALWDEEKAPAPGRRQEGDRLTVVHDGVEVGIQTPAELRERIAATIHSVDVDAYGCPATSRFSADPAHRPDPAVPVESLTGVSAVSVCRYAVTTPDGYPAGAKPLISSSRIEGNHAAVAAVAAAPVGGGPNAPENCLAEYSYGDELIVLRVESDQGASEVVLRYSGCDHNGFDDGAAVRELTRDAVGAVLTGPHRVSSMSGPQAKADMFSMRR